MIQVVLSHHMRALAQIDGQAKLAGTLLSAAGFAKRLAGH
jgi:hypothetical protein